MISRRSLVAGSAGFAAASLLLPGSGLAAVDTDLPPADQGFIYPHEAGPHQRTFMQWPVNREIYSARRLRSVQLAIARIARTVAEFEPVTMLAAEEHHAAIKRATRGNVELMNVPTDDLWARDSGPVFLKAPGKQLAIAELNFNGWGEKQPHDNDAFVSEAVANALNIPRFNAGLTGEGGGVGQDGKGTLIAHASSWINKNRNPFSDLQVDTLMREVLAARHVIWSDGISDLDITDFHIDSLARFVQPGLILMQLPRSRETEDPFEKASWQTYDDLKNARDADGRKFEIVTINGPENPRDRSPDFVSSYVNYYVCNGAVIVPEFGDKTADEKAAGVITELFLRRKIVTLNVDALARNGGGIHCATREMPAL